MSPTEGAALIRIEKKLDGLHVKLDKQSVEIARHDERLKIVEKDQAAVKGKMWSVLVLVVAGAIAGVFDLLRGK